jgi:8-oxo-dGTP pyrophosphatase MutT (NUDIX family)
MKTTPAISLTHLPDKEIPEDTKKFLTVSRNWFQVNYPDKTTSEPILIDSINRRANDAVVIIAWFTDKFSEKQIYLRSCVRPALHFALPDYINQWEFAAGLIEDKEDPREAAARETLEELGFDIPAEQFKPLGNVVIPAASMVPERIFFYMVEVDPSKQKEPTLDGSPLERFGEVTYISLTQALYMVSKDNPFRDAKTELGIYRFHTWDLFEGVSC